MTKRKCPPDCSCFDCLAAMADPNCVDCGGDGYVDVGPESSEVPGADGSEGTCKCTEAKYLKKLEKAGIIMRCPNCRSSNSKCFHGNEPKP